MRGRSASSQGAREQHGQRRRMDDLRGGGIEGAMKVDPDSVTVVFDAAYRPPRTRERQRPRVRARAPGPPRGPRQHSRHEQREHREHAAPRGRSIRGRDDTVGLQRFKRAAAERIARCQWPDADRPCSHAERRALGGLQFERRQTGLRERLRGVDDLILDHHPRLPLRVFLDARRTPFEPHAHAARRRQRHAVERVSVGGQQHALRQHVAERIAERARLRDSGSHGRFGAGEHRAQQQRGRADRAYAAAHAVVSRK